MAVLEETQQVLLEVRPVAQMAAVVLLEIAESTG